MCGYCGTNFWNGLLVDVFVCLCMGWSRNDSISCISCLLSVSQYPLCSLALEELIYVRNQFTKCPTFKSEVERCAWIPSCTCV